MGHKEILEIKQAYENHEEQLFSKQRKIERWKKGNCSPEVEDIAGELSRELTRLRCCCRKEMRAVVTALLLEQPELMLKYPRQFGLFLGRPECRYIQLPEIPKLGNEFERVRKSSYRIIENPRIVWPPGTEEIMEQYTRNDIAQKLERAGACKNVKELADGWIMARALNQLYSLENVFLSVPVVIDKSGCPRLREFCHKNEIHLIQEVK